MIVYYDKDNRYIICVRVMVVITSNLVIDIWYVRFSVVSKSHNYSIALDDENIAKIFVFDCCSN